MKKYRILSITNNPDEYPESIPDSLEFPGLVACVGDEQDIFVLDIETTDYYPASEFFYMINIKTFIVMEQENEEI